MVLTGLERMFAVPLMVLLQLLSPWLWSPFYVDIRMCLRALSPLWRDCVDLMDCGYYEHLWLARSGSLRDAIGFSIPPRGAVTQDAMRGYFQRFVDNTPSFVVIDWRHFTRRYGLRVLALLESYVPGNQQRIVFVHSYDSVPYIHMCCVSIRQTRVLILCG